MERTNLHRDERGAIVVVAVFMAAFLVGCLWYMIGIGDAAVYRQQMQGGADAAAFGSAVYHARGMNMIAMINLNMATLLAVLVAAKTLKLILGIVYAGATAACALAQKADPPQYDGCSEAQKAAEKFQKISQLIQNIEGVGDSSLKALSESATEIAKVAPWVAYSRSAVEAKSYAPSVASGGATSVSMVPAGDRLGLPVMMEDFAVACERGGKVTNSLIMSSIPPEFNEFLGGFAGGLLGYAPAKAYPPKYCEGTSKNLDIKPDFDQRHLCKKAIPPKDQNETEEQYEARIKACMDNPPDDAEIKASNNKQNIPNIDVKNDTPPIQPEEKSTKKIYDQAWNGNDYFQVYGLVRGNIARIQQANGGVDIAGWGKAKVGGVDPMEAIAIAQAEFYYDQTADTPKATFPECWTPVCGLTWKSYEENVLWNMRWRARLRRYRAPSADVDVNVVTDGVENGGFGVIEEYKVGIIDLMGGGGGLGGGSSPATLSDASSAGKPIIH